MINSYSANTSRHEVCRAQHISRIVKQSLEGAAYYVMVQFITSGGLPLG